MQRRYAKYGEEYKRCPEMSSDQGQRQMLDETADDKAEAIHGAHPHNRSVG